MALMPYLGDIVKMTMHIDEGVLAEVMRITGAKSKTKAVEAALKEMARKARLRFILDEGLGLSSDELKDVFDPDSVATMAVAEPKGKYGRHHL